MVPRHHLLQVQRHKHHLLPIHTSTHRGASVLGDDAAAADVLSETLRPRLTEFLELLVQVRVGALPRELDFAAAAGRVLAAAPLRAELAWLASSIGNCSCAASCRGSPS